jgi:hypothetical protein
MRPSLVAGSIVGISVAACGGNVSSSGASAGAPSTTVPDNHRPVAEACPGGPGTMHPPQPGVDAGAFGQCASDFDCSDGLNGRCIASRLGQSCTYDACFVDADCPGGGVCACGGVAGQGNHCLSAGCRVDADCPQSTCSPTFDSCGAYSGVIGYDCHTPNDTCVNDSDCGSSNLGAGYCMFDPVVLHWLCGYGQCVG